MRGLFPRQAGEPTKDMGAAYPTDVGGLRVKLQRLSPTFDETPRIGLISEAGRFGPGSILND